MSKKKLIILMMSLVMACASLGLAAGCGGDDGTPEPAPAPVVEVEYTVTFNSLGGSSVASQKVKSGEKATKPNDPTRDGYNFLYWQLNGRKYEFTTAVTGDITLTAKWAEVKYTVTFKVENETYATAEVVKGRKAGKPTTDPTREGYVFDCWTLNNTEYDFNTAVNSDITLVAKWTKAWLVTFEVGEGSAVDPVWVKTGDPVSAPTTTRDGYNLTDWLLSGVSYDFNTPVTANITLTAVWTANGLTSNQFGINAFGWNQTGNAEYFNITTGASNEMIITAKYAGSTTDYPALVLRNLFGQEYYEAQIAGGNTGIQFNLAIGGDDAASVSDLYVFGKSLSTFPVNAGVYTIMIDLQYIVDNYSTIGNIGTSVKATKDVVDQMLLAWKSTDWTTRNYVFTVSDIELIELPTVEVNFELGSKEMIGIGETTTLTATTNKDSSLIVWSSSDPSVATVVNGVVTGVKGGEVEITANVLGVVASKTVRVLGAALYTNQIGINAWGWDQTNNTSYFGITTGGSGEMVVTAKFSGDTTFYPTLALRNLYSKEYYEMLIEEGYTKLTFSVQVGGADSDKLTDLYVFGTQLSGYAKNTSGVYAIALDLQYIVDNYATIGSLGQSVKAGTSYLGQMLLAWKSTEWTARNYVFTISKPIFTKGVLAANNIGMRVNGNNMLGNTEYMAMDTGDNGELIITTKFQANATYYPTLTLRNLKEKSYYQDLIDNGYTKLTFNLKVGGANASDLDIHILATGMTINQFAAEDGGYRIEISLANIVTFYDTIKTLGESWSQTGQTGSKSAMFISWRSPAGDYTSVRNYVFTISDSTFA